MTDRFQMRVDEDFARLINEWRRRHPALPNKSEAVRALVEDGFKYEKALDLLRQLLARDNAQHLRETIAAQYPEVWRDLNTRRR